MVRAYSWPEADRFLRHCQMVSALGRPDEWSPLKETPENVAVMRARVELCLQTSWGGTEQGHMLKAFAAMLQAPAIVEPEPDPVEIEPPPAAKPPTVVEDEPVDWEEFARSPTDRVTKNPRR